MLAKNGSRDSLAVHNDEKNENVSDKTSKFGSKLALNQNDLGKSLEKLNHVRKASPSESQDQKVSNECGKANTKSIEDQAKSISNTKISPEINNNDVKKPNSNEADAKKTKPKETSSLLNKINKKHDQEIAKVKPLELDGGNDKPHFHKSDDKLAAEASDELFKPVRLTYSKSLKLPNFKSTETSDNKSEKKRDSASTSSYEDALETQCSSPNKIASLIKDFNKQDLFPFTKDIKTTNSK